MLDWVDFAFALLIIAYAILVASLGIAIVILVA